MAKQIPLRNKILGHLIVYGGLSLPLILFFGFSISSARQQYKKGYKASRPIVNASSSRNAYFKCLGWVTSQSDPASWQCTEYKRALEPIRPVPSTLFRQANGLSKGTMTYEYLDIGHYTAERFTGKDWPSDEGETFYFEQNNS